jgi:tetratricopeptide (TPR) repeat protein
MHELLRQYAGEKLDQSPAASEAAHDRHCAYYCAALQRWETDLISARQQTALTEMDVEIENVRTAWNWAVERGQVERVDQALVGLVRFHGWRGRNYEGETACRLAAEKLATTASGDGLRVLAKVLSVRCGFNRMLGRTELASRLVQQSLALLEQLESADPGVRLQKAYILHEMGAMAFGSNREKARQLYEQSLVLFQELGDRWGTAMMLSALGGIVGSLGDFGEAKQLHEESLAIRRTLGDQRTIAMSLDMLSLIAMFQGQLEEGERLVREGLTIRQKLGDRANIAHGLNALSRTLVWRGTFSEAYPLLEESMAIFNDLGLPSPILGLSEVNVHLGRYDQARAQGLASLALNQELDHGVHIGYSLLILGEVAIALKEYTEAERLLQESVATFRAIGEQHDLGLALADIGIAAYNLGHILQARQYLYEALQSAAKVPTFKLLVWVIPVMSLLLADQGEKERSAELYALASRHPFVANSRWFEDIAGKHIAAVAATLPPEVVAAAQERGKARDLWETAAELLAELAGG